jgi:L-arabinose isomerase
MLLLLPLLQLDLNEYADITWEQFSRTRLGFNQEQHLARCGFGRLADVSALWFFAICHQ